MLLYWKFQGLKCVRKILVELIMLMFLFYFFRLNIKFVILVMDDWMHRHLAIRSPYFFDVILSVVCFSFIGKKDECKKNYPRYAEKSKEKKTNENGKRKRNEGLSNESLVLPVQKMVFQSSQNRLKF